MSTERSEQTDQARIADHVQQVAERLAARGTAGVIEIRVRGESDAITIHRYVLGGGKATRDGSSTTPDVSVTMAASDYLDCLAGRADLIRLATSQRLEVAGDMGVALQLAAVFGAVPNPGSADAAASPKPAVPATRRAESVEWEVESVARQRRYAATVERIACPSAEEFRTRFLDTLTPVIVTGVVDRWPIFNQSLAYLKEKAQQHTGLVRQGDYISAAFSDARDFKPTFVSDFIDSMERGESADGLPPYMGNVATPRAFADGIDLSPLAELSELREPQMWLGPAGTVTPLHRDGGDNFFCQIMGEKHFILYSPDQRPLLSCWTTVEGDWLSGSNVDPEHPDYEAYPAFKDARRTDCDVRPGELLFLPQGWFHHVRALTPSLSINFWRKAGRWSSA